ncbi:hypothetical protein GCM10011514_21940 [Emticicia aquatilis]|uniref:Peptidase S8/S53 domain-containing protein n=1 Tax=Emticicia aquatilis TaxID=1537369 RepID=A0A916YRE7_9BACT|nr:S8 family serine peptidase [Emticicia aquatilis]GGD57443.1 hypothetical protein GCM10011514_21940 [Emticicia aquatilis]
MKNILTFILSLIFLITYSQDINNPQIVESVPENIRIDATLYNIGKLAATNRAAAETQMSDTGLRMRSGTNGEKLINVEVVYKNDYNATKIEADIDKNYLENLGFKVETLWKNRASIWLNADEIMALGSKLDSRHFMFAVRKILHDNEGPTTMNSDSYSGVGGSGIRVAIIDSGFGSLSSAVSGGHCPTPAYMWRNGSQVATVASMTLGDVHGTACVETVYDHVPNATFELYDVGNDTEKGAAVNLCQAHGVKVISMSLSTYNTGWADDTGAACVAANDAGSSGILFFTSCGNRAQTHWEGSFSDSDADNWHNWSGSDEQNNRTAGPGDYIRASLSWNPVANSDYDVYIYRASDNTVLASSTNSGLTFEDVGWTNTSGSSVSIYIAVKKIGSASPTFEIFSHDDGSAYQYQVASGSNTSPSNSTNDNVLSVGAVPYTSYGSAAGTSGIIASYSSQGPTNSGNLAPAISSATNTTTFVYGGSFGGTSCATPNAAGMAAAFWSGNSYLDGTGVRQILLKKAQIYKDWGTSGVDYIYGNGGVFLYDYEANTRYMYRGANNTTGLTTRPFYTFAQAQTNTPNNGKVVILGGTYGENLVLGASGGLNKKIRYLALKQTAYAGL